MASLLALVLFGMSCLSAANQPPPTTLPPMGCYRNGKMYQIGEEFFVDDNPCQPCTCEQPGEGTCMYVDCASTMCVDFVKDPDQCCGSCPNGSNCKYGDVTIKVGEVYKPDQDTWCECPPNPNEYSFGNTVVEAVCIAA